ncbi:uncharacterized protein RHIMIDRAFT_265581 [Rhizopus microsporus ATCC 52813]|uniref:Uncharacterized protein n=2 Tax=Rhizopus microsporus TaxID=58291 RepID=A0A2G4T5I7_RHIZD|nr:uncharacterized protein RHIMIDRAFT_265581 [Rhizopus microsporus ATCC 52813]PHZ16268.1 hypothetical protein RHIMIDRAFT_265581 [Rhizopus microsporus ATCC 52813]
MRHLLKEIRDNNTPRLHVSTGLSVSRFNVAVTIKDWLFFNWILLSIEFFLSFFFFLGLLIITVSRNNKRVIYLDSSLINSAQKIYYKKDDELRLR